MASRVNTRFVAFLAIGLMLLGGGAMVAVYFTLKKGAADYERLGDRYMAEANYEKATEYYGKAVHKKQTNPVYLDKWIKAMEKTTPTPRTVYLDRYLGEYRAALRGYANALPEDVEAQKRYLGEWWSRMRLIPPRAPDVWDSFIQEVEDAIGQFEDPAGARELRRYRGLANLHKIGLLPADKQKTLMGPIKDDLEAALAANPADEEAASELANIRMKLSEEARAEGNIAEAQRLEEEAVRGLEEYTSKHGKSSRILWRQMQIEFLQAAQRAEEMKVPLTRSQLYEDKHARFVEVMDLLRSEPKEKLDLVVLVQVCREAARSAQIGNAGVLELLAALEERMPESVFLKILVGRYETLSRHYGKAVAAYQRVIDMPDLPVSFEGWLLFDQRAEAYRQQILAKLAEREAIVQQVASGTAAGVNPDDAKKLLDEAKELRTKLAEYVGESERVLQYVDARIAHAEGNFEAARINLDRYLEGADQDVGALHLYGSIMHKLGNIGAARGAFQKVLAQDPDNLATLLELAELETRDQNFAMAERLLEGLQKLYPTMPEIQEQISRVRVMKIAKEGGKVEDVVVAAKFEAQRLVSGVNPDFAGAAKVLRDAIRASGDLTLYPMLARVLQVDGKTEEALAVVDEGLLKAPNNERLKAMRDLLKEKDPLQAMLKSIDQDEKGTDFQKHAWRAVVYLQFAKTEEAKAALEDAAKIEPNHPLVLEMKFKMALAEKNTAEAKRVADHAASVNADNVGGLSYKAQMELSEGRLSDAAATLEAVVDKDRNNPVWWRQLGRVRLQMGRNELAATAFERALAIRPYDIEAIKGLLGARIGMGQREQALALARANQEVGVADMDFVDIWLDLEATTAGGDRDKALEQRRALAKRFPKNERNNTALVMQLLAQQRFAEAKPMIDRLRSESPDSAAYVELEVRWHTAQGNLRAAIDTFNRWVVTLPADKHTEQPYIALADIFLSYGKVDAAILSLEDGGRKHQDPKTMGADRRLGEVYFLADRYVQAIETFDRVLAANPSDPEYRINGQIVEAYIRLRRFAEAKRRIDALGAGIESNSRMLLLKGAILAGSGDLEEASRTFDAAVAAAKDDPVSYIKRAEFLMVNDPRRIGDAEQDLKQALVLNPRHMGARVMLARLHLNRNDNDKAVEVMREGLAADPDNDTLRWDLTGLYLRLKRDLDAIRLVEDALRRRPEDPLWLFRGREVMYALERWDDAANYAWRLWERKKDADAALAYLDAAIKQRTTDYVKALQVLSTPELKTQQDMRLLMARARLQLKRQRAEEARQDLKTALELTDQTKAGPSQTFFAGMSVVYPDPKERLGALTGLRPREGYKGWMAFLYSNLKSSFPESREEGLSELRALAENPASELLLRKQCYAVIGSRWRTEKNYEEGIRWWKTGLELDPADPELNNNVAYSTSEDLKKPAEGLPYAEKAAKAMPNNPSILDTLGTVYMRVSQLDKADEAFGRGLSYAASADEATPLLLHLAELRLQQAKKNDADALLRRAEELMNTDSGLKEQFDPLLKELRQKMQSN